MEDVSHHVSHHPLVGGHLLEAGRRLLGVVLLVAVGGVHEVGGSVVLVTELGGVVRGEVRVDGCLYFGVVVGYSAEGVPSSTPLLGHLGAQEVKTRN